LIVLAAGAADGSEKRRRKKKKSVAAGYSIKIIDEDNTGFRTASATRPVEDDDDDEGATGLLSLSSASELSCSCKSLLQFMILSSNRALNRCAYDCKSWRSRARPTPG